jgi:hypothetical protein
MAALAFIACAAPELVATRQGSANGLGLFSNSPSLVECPTSDSSSVTAVVGPLGGLVSAGGASISIPAGALLSPVAVTVTVPPSRYVEIDVSVAGTEHFFFESPVSVTVPYGRCSRGDLDLAPLTVWYIDGASKALLAPMPSVDDKIARTVTFTTGHLSGYAVAN